MQPKVKTKQNKTSPAFFLSLCPFTWAGLQSRPTLCDPMDCSPPGSSVQEWVAMPSSRGSFQPRGWPDPASPMSPALADRVFTTSTIWETCPSTYFLFNSQPLTHADYRIPKVCQPMKKQREGDFMAHQLAYIEMQSSVKGDHPSPILTRVQMYSSLTDKKKKMYVQDFLLNLGSHLIIR